MILADLTYGTTACKWNTIIPFEPLWEQYERVIKDNGVSEIKLDEKKIRKGRSIGLPYVGSKKKIAKKFIQLIIQNFGDDKKVYDIFGGGGAITAECMINGLDVHYNDLDKTVVDMFTMVLNSDREWLKRLVVDREQFFYIRDKENKTTEDELKLLVNSFGNNRKSYLYGKDHSDFKYQLALEIIANHDLFGGYRQSETYKKALINNPELSRQRERMQQLERLEQLERLRQVEVENEELFTALDYREFSNVSGGIIYLDPPYETSEFVYRVNGKGGLNYEEFYNWAYDMAQKNIVIISSYEVSDERFEEVFRFDTARGTFNGGQSEKREKLFMVKEGNRLINDSNANFVKVKDAE